MLRVHRQAGIYPANFFCLERLCKRKFLVYLLMNLATLENMIIILHIRALFKSLLHFTRRLPIHYICPKINKAECQDDELQIFMKLSKKISEELKKNYEYLNSYDLQIIYYDYGQTELTKIILSVFNSVFSNIEMRKVNPSDYKLFQVADLICTMELTKYKAERNALSNSELEFFHSARDFRKNLYKYLEKKKL